MSATPDIVVIQDLIAEDNLVQALGELVSIAREKSWEDLDILIILSRDLHSLKKASLKGIISWQEENIERRKISSRLLELLKIISSSDLAA